jgi:hypothetical protein
MALRQGSKQSQNDRQKKAAHRHKGESRLER